MQKILSSALIMAMVSIGAYAADEMITGGANTCTVDVLGVSADGVTANTIAVWSIDKYTLAPGEYLNVTETSVEPAACPPGSYCVGGADFTVENASTSIATCPTAYPNSRAGAGAQNQCYTACTVATANIAHATAVGGNDYFGDGSDACYATACDTGYHVDGEVELVEKTPVIPVDYRVEGNDYGYINTDGSEEYQSTKYGLNDNNTWAVNFGYGTVYGKASCQPEADPAWMHLDNEVLDSLLNGSKTFDELRAEMLPKYGIAKTEAVVGYLEYQYDPDSASDEEHWAAYAKLLTILGDKNIEYSSGGSVCYCQINAYMDLDNTRMEVLNAPWIMEIYGEQSNCMNDCAKRCTYAMTGISWSDRIATNAGRAAMFGAFEAQISGTCIANTINIDWNPDNGGEHTKNMCTYDGAITLPTPDPVKPGYTFTGWKLLEETATE